MGANVEASPISHEILSCLVANNETGWIWIVLGAHNNLFCEISALNKNSIRWQTTRNSNENSI